MPRHQGDDGDPGYSPYPVPPSAQGPSGTPPQNDPSRQTPAPPMPQVPPGLSAWDQIVWAYKTFLGRTPSDAEVRSHLGNGQFSYNDPRVGQSISNIYNSPEANTYRTQQASSAGQWKGMSLSEIYQKVTQGQPPTSATLAKLYDAYKAAGYNVQYATHAGGQQSDDKLVINGQTYDFIRDVGGPNAGWQEPNWGGGGGGGGGNPNMDRAAVEAALNNSPFTRPWTQEFNYADWKPPAPFQAPTNVTEQNDPGYQFRLQQGQLALEHSAAARGTLLSGQTMRDLTDYAQNAASAEYGNVYGRALQNYQTQYNTSQNDWVTNYNKALQGYQQSYNIFENNQANQFNRVASLMGAGQTAAGQLNSSGLGYAQLGGQTALGLGNTLGNIYTGQGNAYAAGQVGAGNAYGNFFGNLGNYAFMSPYMNRQPNYNPYQTGYTPPPGMGNYGGFLGQGGQYY